MDDDHMLMLAYCTDSRHLHLHRYHAARHAKALVAACSMTDHPGLLAIMLATESAQKRDELDEQPGIRPASVKSGGGPDHHAINLLLLLQHGILTVSCVFCNWLQRRPAGLLLEIQSEMSHCLAVTCGRSLGWIDRLADHI